MKRLLIAAATLALVGQVHAFKACEELKTEIATKLDTAGVKGYALNVVDADKVADAKVVGSCEGGKKKITYSKK